MFAITFLLFAALASRVFGDCLSRDCKTCLNSQASYVGESCYYYPSCGYCTSQSTNNPPTSTCDGETPVRSPSLCPVVPTAAQAVLPLTPAYWLIFLGVIAVGVTALLAYSPLERFCGQKPSSSLQHDFGYSRHLLFVSCCFLWFGLSLSLAAPALPWLVSASVRETDAASAFFFIGCPIHYKTKATFCQQVPLMQILSGPFAPTTPADLVYAQNGLALGVIAYIVTIGLLFHCALMTSIALYRLSRLAKNGTPPYTSGCSPASLSVAQTLGWTSFSVFCIAFFCALALCSAVANKLNADGPSFLFYGESDGVQYKLMPGSVAAGVSIALQLLGLLIQNVVARSLTAVHGLGCNSGGCCRQALDDGYEPPIADGSALLGSPQYCAPDGSALLGTPQYCAP